MAYPRAYGGKKTKSNRHNPTEEVEYIEAKWPQTALVDVTEQIQQLLTHRDVSLKRHAAALHRQFRSRTVDGDANQIRFQPPIHS